ncbi:MAG: hypothetical protein OEV40_22730, partial [Acidimicrobiia bacterium]|nr:hypothetical protein [Acidimicrobiia bacterium]
MSEVRVTGPLAPFAVEFEAELLEWGYTPLTVVNQLRQMGRLSHWIEENGLTVAELSDERVEEFLAWQRSVGRHRGSWSRPGLRCLLGVLRRLGAADPEGPAVVTSSMEVLLASFERHLLAERGLTAGTIRGYVRHARQLLDGLASSGGLGCVTAGKVTEAVVGESGAVSVSATQFFIAGLRSFLRFCFIEGV